MKIDKLSLEERKKLLEEIVWPKNEPLMFERRRGRCPTNVEELYEKAHSEENIKKMAKVGIDLLPRVHYYKGFGFETEREEIEKTRKLVELCHKYGIRIGVYIGGTIFIETFFLEKPEAKDWIQRDQDGNPVTYSGYGTYRYLPCYNSEEYLEYLKKVIKYAIEELKVDSIFFDNPGIGKPEPQSCHCPRCVKKFREFLREKYDDETLKKRLGFTVLEGVFPPRYDVFNQPWTMKRIDDPLRQEWIDFRCQVKADFYRKLYRYIKELNPSVSVSLNIKGIYGKNRAFREAIDHPRFVGACDSIVMDSGVSAGLTEDGVLVSEIRSFKAARTLNLTVDSPPGRGGKVEWAVAMAFNRHYYGDFSSFAYHPDPETLHYYDFFKEHEDLYVDTENIADVAILRSFASMAYNNFDTHLSTILFEQTLIQSKIPFDIIFDENLKDLSKYSVLVLANQESLSDAQLERIQNFVKKGGGLIATESTSLYDEWRRKRPQYGLADLFGFRKPEEAHKTMNHYGDGRVVYIPKIVPSRRVPSRQWTPTIILETVEQSGYVTIQPDQWRLPENWSELVEAVEWAGKNNLSLKVHAPLTVVAEILKKEKKNQIILHLINFDDKHLLKEVYVDLKVPAEKNVKEIRVLSPDVKETESLEYIKNGDKISFIVPELKVYDLILIQLI